MSPRTRGSLRLRLEAFERLGAVRRFAADCFFALVRRFVTVRRLAVVRRFAAVRRFTGVRFFRDERDAAERFLRFAINCLPSEASTLSKKISSHRGGKRISAQRVRIGRQPSASAWPSGFAHRADVCPSGMDDCKLGFCDGCEFATLLWEERMIALPIIWQRHLAQAT